MFRKKGLEKSLALLVTAIGLILLYSWFFASSVFYIAIALIVLGIFSVFVLSDLLVSWVMILGIVLATVILVYDVVYLRDQEVLLLLFTFPLSAWLASQVNFHLQRRLSLVQDKSEAAAAAYDELIQKLHLGETESFQALLIHWSHNRHFLQINSREYKRMLKQIFRLLKWSFRKEALYYVSDGSFLVLTSQEDPDLKDYFRDHVRPDLLTMLFENKHSQQKIQFQSGQLKISEQNADKFHSVDQALSNLERQLETDIIVEY